MHVTLGLLTVFGVLLAVLSMLEWPGLGLSGLKMTFDLLRLTGKLGSAILESAWADPA